MNVLFLHPNFPAQFRHMAAALGADPANQVVFATMNERPEWKIPGVRKAVFQVKRKGPQAFFLARHFEESAMKGEAMYAMGRELKNKGFVPDVMVAHSGWGTSLFLKDLFPDTPLLCFFEWFYRAQGADADFDPADPLSESGRLQLRTKNAAILIDLDACDFGYTPTGWQKAQFPKEFHGKMAVRHDGVDVSYFAPAPETKLVLPELDLSQAKEIVTYATRGMEPYRGFPQFMEALPAILEQRPDCHVVIAGEDRVCYGKKLPEGKTYKELLLDKVAIDPARVHFTGSLPYGHYKCLLQASTVHVYLTRPFVLSWSMLEAMACGCLVVGSDTAPVREVLEDGVNGLLTDFFSPQAIADRVVEALTRREELEPLRQAARRTITEGYALQTLLPDHVRLVRNLGEGRNPLDGMEGEAQSPKFG
jgi:glycosyltransferase involved in cell wall biosynthesis